MAKLQAYELQDSGLDTVEANEQLGFKADQRDFALPGQMLKALGVTRVRLLSNNPEKVEALERAGIEVVERVPCEVTAESARRRIPQDQEGKAWPSFLVAIRNCWQFLPSPCAACLNRARHFFMSNSAVAWRSGGIFGVVILCAACMVYYHLVLFVPEFRRCVRPRVLEMDILSAQTSILSG